MVEPDALNNLRDIHLPPPISVWPPGLGYFILLGILFFLVLLLIKRRQYLRYTAPKREALAELARLEASYLQQPDPSQTAAAITLLLKRVALVYHPRLDVAHIHGEAWLQFLKKTSRHLDSNIDATGQILRETPFNPKADHPLEPLFLMARRWIKQRRKKCSN